MTLPFLTHVALVLAAPLMFALLAVAGVLLNNHTLAVIGATAAGGSLVLSAILAVIL